MTVVGSVGVSGSLNASSINTTGSAYFGISGAGKVGINTTTPAQTLTVQGTLNVTADGTAGPNLFVASDGNVGIGTTSPGMKLVVVGNVNISQNLTVNNSVLFVDGTSGRVGIGTVSPAHKLHIIGNVNITGSFNATRIEANEILVNGAIVNRSIDLSTYNFSISLDDYNESIDLSSYNFSISLTNYLLKIGEINSTAWNYTGAFGSGDIVTADQEANVGIGTTSPTERLVIMGNLSVN
ncbi:MAG: hypothetical protein IH836_00805, partial [Proteobacteria bacterium]|nr:hypothetical protein [Pseudomonadota bacterium]